MKLTVFVSNAGSTSARPGESQNTLRLVLPPKTDRVDDENKDVFPNGANKNVIVEIHGLSDEALEPFRGGTRVTLTIEPAK